MAGLVCGNCGATNPAGSRFCASCDGFLDWEGQPEEVDTAPAPAPARGAPAPVEPARPQPPADPFPEPVPPAGWDRPAPAPAALSQPASAYQARAAAPPATATEPDVGILRCPHCGTANPPGRRFCRRCGDWLVDPSPPVDIAPTAWRARVRGPWWRRIFSQRAAYTTPLTTTTVVFRAVGALVAVVVVSLLLGLFGFNPIGRARDYVQHLLGSGRVEGVQAATDPAAQPETASWAVDNYKGRGWSTGWLQSTPDVADACAATPPQAVAGKLALALPGATNVREIGVEAGLGEDDPQRATHYRPKIMRLDWEGGGCQTVKLADDPGLQRFGVRQGDVTKVTLTVVSTYAPASAAAGGGVGSVLDISEVTVWKR